MLAPSNGSPQDGGMYIRNCTMAAPIEIVPKHHQRDEVCSTRCPYREGRIPKAVKVYTINHESRFVLVQGVPAVGASHELVKLLALYGAIEEYRILDDYPSDQFTEVYLICYKKIQSARFAKKKLDDYSFFGGVLHICYAPEYESVEETRQKLQDRRKVIAAKTRQNASSAIFSSSSGNNGIENTDEFASNITQEKQVYSNTHHGNETYETKSVDASQTLGSWGFPKQNTKDIQHSKSNLTDQLRPVPHGHTHLQMGDNSFPINFSIPPPPLPGRNPSYFRGHSSKFEFAHVPSAHATLPTNFDGRLPNTSNLEKKDIDATSNKQKSKFYNESSNKLNTKDSFICDTKPESVSSKTSNGEKDGSKVKVKEKVIGGLVIRDYKKKGSVPRFVPRQAMTNAGKANTQTESPDKPSVEDELNKQIKRNAFMLGKTEGPVVQNKDMLKAPLNIPVEREQSVNQTVLDIRKRISKFISDITPVSKKKKTS